MWALYSTFIFKTYVFLYEAELRVFFFFNSSNFLATLINAILPLEHQHQERCIGHLFSFKADRQ